MAERPIAIAVMPFRRLSAESRAAYFADGFVEDLIGNLTRFGSLRVVASQSSFGATRLRKAPPDIAKAWDLQYILEGSVRTRGDTLRVGTQLIRVDGWQTVWADRFDAPLNEVFAIQDEITATVAGKLAARIDDTQLARARGRSMEELQAYDCWLRGQECLRRGTLEGDEEARSFFRQALAIDPAYARAYSGLSVSHFNEWTCQAWHLWDESSENAYDHAARAAELDPTDAMVQAVLARVCRFRHEHARADRHAANALGLNPHDPHVLIQVALTTLFNGQPEEAYELACRASRLNPLNGDWYPGVIGWCLFMADRHQEALPQLQRAGEAITNLAAYRAACHVLAGDRVRARDEYGLFEHEYQRRIVFGRELQPGEALRWAVQVEPFRHPADSRRMPEVLRAGGLAEIDVEDVLRTRAGPMVRAADIDRPPGNVFRREGEGGVWSLAYKGRGAKLVELKGFHDIGRLLARPGVPLHCLELTGVPHAGLVRHDVLDARARHEYRQRIEDLQDDLERAASDNDPARAEPLRVELETLLEELARTAGLGGRPRQFASRAERARSAVTWRIRSAIKKIAAAHPHLGQHLENTIRTGSFCVYTPEAAMEWQL